MSMSPTGTSDIYTGISEGSVVLTCSRKTKIASKFPKNIIGNCYQELPDRGVIYKKASGRIIHILLSYMTSKFVLFSEAQSHLVAQAGLEFATKSRLDSNS